MAIFGALAPILIPAAIGAFTSYAMGRDPLKGAVLGGATGGLLNAAGGAGGLFNLGSSTGAVTESAVSSAASGGATAFGANQAPNVLASKFGSGATSGVANAFGSTTGNAIPNYDMGMQGVTANYGGFTASADPSQVLASKIQPIRNSAGEIIGPDMSRTQQFIDTTPDITNAKFGSVDPNTLDYTQGQKVQNQFGYEDGVPNKTNLEIGPDMSKVTKPDPVDPNTAGGYEKPLFERVTDSLIGYATSNPVDVLGAGVLLAGGIEPRSQQIQGGNVGSITKGTPPSDSGRPLAIRRPTKFA